MKTFRIRKERIATCAGCGTQLKPDDIYPYRGEPLCARCCMEARMPLTRKTHWQYLRSIKADYRRDAKRNRK